MEHIAGSKLAARGSRGVTAVLIAWASVLLQVTNLSFLVDTPNIGTLFVVAFVAFGLCLVFSYLWRPLVFSAAHGWALLIWLLLLAGALQAFNQEWALLSVGIGGVYLLCFFLFANLSCNRPLFEKLVDSLLVIGLLGALLGLYERLHFLACGPNRSPLIPYLLPPDLNPRVGGPYGQANLFALFLTLVLLAYFYRFLHHPKNSGPWAVRLRFIPVLTVATVFFLTYSRGGMVSLGLVFGALTWLVVTGRYLAGQRESRKVFFLLLLCLGVGLLISQIPFPGSQDGSGTASRLVATETGSNTNSAGRLVFWTSAILMFLDHPWLGAGLDNYRFLMNGYGPTSHKALGFVEFEAMMSTHWAHNEYLQLLCEGGIFVFALVLFFLLAFGARIRRNFIRGRRGDEPQFLYSHLFLFPFLAQSLFEWPLRHPGLLLLFVAFAGILVAQYPLRTVALSGRLRGGAVAFALLGLAVTGLLLFQEKKIMDFRRAWLSQPLETTVDDFAELVGHPYSSYRVLRKAMPRYTVVALHNEDDALARTILPYSEQLVHLEGKAGQWYDLARLYLRVNRLVDARIAIREAFELRPTDPIIFEFLHYLNVLEASRATGRPVESFYPRRERLVDFNLLEIKDD